MLIFPLFNGRLMAESLGLPLGEATTHTFPDGETLVRLITPVQGREVYFLTSLDRPNKKMLPLLFAADAARANGATAVHLIAPYLAYMRQDKAFHEGEGISALTFTGLLSSHFDGLITIDPHLHRIHALQDIMPIKTSVLHAAKPIAAWIKANIAQPVLIGPDSESQQWVQSIAVELNVPYCVAEKNRASDTAVSVILPLEKAYHDYTPVLIDDIISSGHTMAANIEMLLKSGWQAPVCIGVHAVFAPGAEALLSQAGAANLITCNTILHPSNRIHLGNLISDALNQRTV